MTSHQWSAFSLSQFAARCAARLAGYQGKEVDQRQQSLDNPKHDVLREAGIEPSVDKSRFSRGEDIPVPQRPKPRFQELTIFAQDPGVRTGEGRQRGIVRAKVRLPAEFLRDGPWGYRVQVVDYDASSDMYCPPHHYHFENDLVTDPFEKKTDRQLLNDPQFHQQNVYAIVMRILTRFEHALGRRVSWSFGGHQLKVAPHAFADANAFYSKEDECLLFGYFVDPKYLATGKRPRPGQGIVFTCLSHDVVAHETTHALVDGLRERYTEPSSADQAAFHEGISDVVALLSVFSLKAVVELLLADQKDFSAAKLRNTVLFRLAEEMGSAVSKSRGAALRRSLDLKPDTSWKEDPEYEEPHRRGEILVAAMLNALIHIWAERIAGLRKETGGRLDITRVVEEGQRAADILLTMSIRALDYCPPVHIEFADYLSALLTADHEIRPDDSVFEFRRHLRESFAGYGIRPASGGTADEPGIWIAPQSESAAWPGDGTREISYDRTHFAAMQHDSDEVFRFVWENQDVLRLCPEAYTQVQSVRPCVRLAEDGFQLRETVAEYVQVLRLMPDDLRRKGVRLPSRELLPDDIELFLHGGGTLVFDEYGRLKFHVHNTLEEPDGTISPRQLRRIDFLARRGYFLSRPRVSKTSRARQPGVFGQMHLNRGLNRMLHPEEGWAYDAGHSDNAGVAAGHQHEEPVGEDDAEE